MQIFMTMCRWFLVSVTVVILTACGGGTSDKSDTKQQIAIEKIMRYADDESNTVPTLQDYQDAKVSGVTAENLDELNDLVDALVAEDVDTVEELNTLTTELGVNIAPISNAGADTTVQVNQAVAITGSGNDSDGSITGYRWTENNNELANTASFTYTPTTIGEHTLTLTVTDDDGSTASDTMTVTVTEILNQTPASNAGANQTVQLNQAVSITGSGSDSDGSIVSYQWTENNNELANTASFTYTPTTIGEHTLTLTVTDDDGSTASDTMTVTVTEILNQTPASNAGANQTVQVNQAVSITGSGSDSDGSIVSYQWMESENILANTASFSYTATAIGDHTLTLIVTDDGGATASDTMTVTATEIPNQAPTSNAGANQTVQVNQTVTITGSGSDSDGSITRYQWTKNGNVLANTTSFNYTPTTTGDHTLTLTVTDDGGATASDTLTVTATFDATPIAPLGYTEYKLSPLNDSDFNMLNQAQKYQVASKLYATLFYGTDYKTLTTDITSDAFISQTRDMFDQANDVSDITDVEERLLTYKGWGDGEIIAPMLARLFHLPPGKEYLNRWAAYILTQTILFSPAFELDTVETSDAIIVYNSLVRDFDNDLSLQWITYKHMMTNENWRRFRSPEDNGREMLEIFLMDFNDAHVPLAAKALQNWQLDRRSNMLVITLNENTEPITDLFEGTTIVNGTDFYKAISLHPDFLTTVSSRLVDIYFPNYTEIEKNRIIIQLVSSKPTSWTGLLKQIVYSKEYLLNSEKTRSFEETFLPISKILDWHPHEYSFMSIYQNLNEMHQSAMRYKLGRETEVPLDSQSFAWYHKTIREKVMINYETNTSFESWDDGWALKDTFDTLPEELDTKEKIAEHIIHTLFIPIIGRDANPTEIQFFQDMIDGDKYNSRTFNNYRWVTLIGNDDPEDDLKERGYFESMVLDYLSRLSRTYTFDAVQ